MGYCAIHHQAYNESIGGFCPYCGDQQKIKFSDSTKNIEEEKSKDQEYKEENEKMDLEK